jgi:hypothetical protein
MPTCDGFFVRRCSWRRGQLSFPLSRPSPSKTVLARALIRVVPTRSMAATTSPRSTRALHPARWAAEVLAAELIHAGTTADAETIAEAGTTAEAFRDQGGVTAEKITADRTAMRDLAGGDEAAVADGVGAVFPGVSATGFVGKAVTLPVSQRWRCPPIGATSIHQVAPAPSGRRQHPQHIPGRSSPRRTNIIRATPRAASPDGAIPRSISSLPLFRTMISVSSGDHGAMVISPSCSRDLRAHGSQALESRIPAPSELSR